MARECTQAWGPSFSVSRTDHSMEVEDDSDTSSSACEGVPSTTASVTSPVVTSPPVISTCPPVTSVRSTAAVPTSCPTVAVTAPVKSSTGPVTMTTAASVPTTSSAPTFGLSTSVSTASSTPVCTRSLSTSASLTTSPASASSKKVDPGLTLLLLFQTAVPEECGTTFPSRDPSDSRSIRSCTTVFAST